MISASFSKQSGKVLLLRNFCKQCISKEAPQLQCISKEVPQLQDLAVDATQKE
jgi:hypothetical protein